MQASKSGAVSLIAFFQLLCLQSKLNALLVHKYAMSFQATFSLFLQAGLNFHCTTHTFITIHFHNLYLHSTYPHRPQHRSNQNNTSNHRILNSNSTRSPTSRTPILQYLPNHQRQKISMPSKTKIQDSTNTGPKLDRSPPDNNKTKHPSHSSHRPTMIDAATQTDPTLSPAHESGPLENPQPVTGSTSLGLGADMSCHPARCNDNASSYVIRFPRPSISPREIWPPVQFPPRLRSIDRIRERSAAAWKWWDGHGSLLASPRGPGCGSGSSTHKSIVETSTPYSDSQSTSGHTIMDQHSFRHLPDHAVHHQPAIPEEIAVGNAWTDPPLEVKDYGMLVEHSPNVKPGEQTEFEHRSSKTFDGKAKTSKLRKEREARVSMMGRLWQSQDFETPTTLSNAPSPARSAVTPRAPATPSSSKLGGIADVWPAARENNPSRTKWIKSFPVTKKGRRYRSYSSPTKRGNEDDDDSKAALPLSTTADDAANPSMITLQELFQWLKMEATGEMDLKEQQIPVQTVNVICFRAGISRQPQPQGYRHAQMGQQPKLRFLERTLKGSAGSSSSGTRRAQEDPVDQIRARQAAQEKAAAKKASEESGEGSRKAGKGKEKRPVRPRDAPSVRSSSSKRKLSKQSSDAEVDVSLRFSDQSSSGLHYPRGALLDGEAGNGDGGPLEDDEASSTER